MMRYFTVVVRILAAAALLAPAGPVAAQDAYPDKPIRFIVPFPPGGSTTPVARLIGQKLAESWGQPVIVDNRPGGNTIIGTEAVAKAPPDGYTILLISSPFVTGPGVRRFLPYDTIKDFDAVATISKAEYILVINPSVPTSTLQEFVALAKSKPGQLNLASSGVGNAGHLAGELLQIMAGIKMQHIPYKGGGQIIIDLIGGQVQAYFASPIVAIPHIRSGRVKAIAISGETRSPALPQVPTFTEAGLPGFDAKNWFGVVTTAGTPKAIIDKMSIEIVKILAMPDIENFFAKQGIEPLISTPNQVAALIKADIAKYAKIIKDANLKIRD